MVENELIKRVESVIYTGLPQFAVGDETFRRGRKRGVNFLTRLNSDIYQRVSFNFEVSRECVSIAVQVAANIFRECPLLGGPFGFSSYIVDLLKQPSDTPIQRFWYSGGWYLFNSSDQAKFFNALTTVITHDVASALSNWAIHLTSTPWLEASRVISDTFVVSGRSIHEVMSDLIAKLDCFQSKMPYPVEKIAKQLTYKLFGVKNWHAL